MAHHLARLRMPLVAALIGALLGATAVAWRTDSLPLLGEDAACWGSLSEGEVDGLAGDGAQVDELPPEERRGNLQASCRIVPAGGDDFVEFRVHYLDRLDRAPRADPEGWLEEFLGSGMTWLGGGLTGMASSGKAWLALPETCREHDQFEGPVIVDVSADPREGTTYGEEGDRAARDFLARVVTRVANGTMDALGCEGTLPLPDPEELPALPATEEPEPDRLCGLPGLTLPAPARDGLSVERVTSGDGPFRACSIGYREGQEFRYRLVTIEHPSFTAPLYDLGRGQGDGFEGPTTWGVVSPAFAIAHATCQTGRVIFVFQQIDPLSLSGTLARDVFPGYVAAEAERIGCDPVEVDLPE